jgi:predicted metal-dependent hydrolase
VEAVEINGRRYPVAEELTTNRTASASLRDGSIILRIPRRWCVPDRQRIGGELLTRAVKSISSGRWQDGQNGRVRFHDGQAVTAMGREFRIAILPGRRFGSRERDGRIEVRVVEGHPEKDEKASWHARRRIVHAVQGELSARVHELNRLHFGASIRKISVRDNSSRWGSCSRDGSISLNFRLLFMPAEILDYVIIHELAHTKYRSHGPRFWAIVEKAEPRYLERRKWLRQNGWCVPAPCGSRDSPPPAAGQQALSDFSDEPY